MAGLLPISWQTSVWVAASVTNACFIAGVDATFVFEAIIFGDDIGIDILDDLLSELTTKNNTTTTATAKETMALRLSMLALLAFSCFIVIASPDLWDYWSGQP